MKVPGTAIAAASLGVATMYWLDPQQGKRRRAIARDKALHLAHATADLAGKASRDLRNRSRGLGHEVIGAVSAGTIDDQVLVERVRAKLGHHVSHPSAIDVDCRDASCTLSGPVLADEADEAVDAVARVRGVCEVVDRLERHATPDGVPALQGPRRRAVVEDDPLRRNWTPAARLLGGSIGGALLALAAVKRQPLTLIGGAIGAGLLARSLRGQSPVIETRGNGVHRAFQTIETVHVAAPIERVFELWSHPESFPLFMEHLVAVQPLGNGRYRWQAHGPAGAPVEWETEVVEVQPNRLIRWRSVEGSPLESEGAVHFDAEASGTRVQIEWRYRPPAGAVGKALLSLSGRDPRSALDEDMVRFKSLLEDGKTRAHGREVYLDMLEQLRPEARQNDTTLA